MPSPIMTPQEVCEELRARGVSTTAEKIRAGIEQGAYDFGVVIHLTTPCFEIYRKKFEQWLKENIEQ